MENRNCIEIKGITKKYKKFNLSIDIPYGTVMGFVGENGAGKTTTIKAILGLLVPDSGSVTVMGENAYDMSNGTREKIGVVFDTPPFPQNLNAKQLNTVFKNMYKSWDGETFFNLLDKFDIPTDKKLKTFSRGMGMRFSIAQALSHNAELLVLDEPTGGLDPIVRSEIIDILRDFMTDENHTIFISTHITSDLDRLADYICFVHKGKVVFTEERNELIEKYRILKCTDEQLSLIDKNDIIGMRKGRFQNEVLTNAADKYPDIAADKPNIDEIMVYLISRDGE